MGPGVNVASTVRPVCGRADSAADIASSGVATVFGRAQPATATAPAMLAATNVRRLNCVELNNDSAMTRPGEKNAGDG
ncbi:hypothetical protein QQA43_31135 (plasmid) [Mycolicibacterium vanbaalenii]|uniref:hypothetical protein n=1 Tax=Mycolicibacterium TaxID=1866885 RepID=UPI0027E254EE|nr:MULTISPECIES: hypothetical protein [Mycolicibacterium]WND60502.1 hypothetical protein QQA43_31135 [Mycolicibacterium vanbaalenii]